jgi:hypothetical protein
LESEMLRYRDILRIEETRNKKWSLKGHCFRGRPGSK